MEMKKTQQAAEEATKLGKGKHHIGDFIPKDELERFLETAEAVTTGREADLSDYKKHTLTKENVGFKVSLIILSDRKRPGCARCIRTQSR